MLGWGQWEGDRAGWSMKHETPAFTRLRGIMTVSVWRTTEATRTSGLQIGHRREENFWSSPSSALECLSVGLDLNGIVNIVGIVNTVYCGLHGGWVLRKYL